MPRGRAPGYEEQRELILARAAARFAQNGYSGTSMNEVAEACGVSKPTLYHYVRDKRQLLVEIAEAHIGRLIGIVEQVDVEMRTATAEARVRRLIDAFVDIYARSQAEHRVLTEDVRFLGAADRRRVLDGQRKVVAAFAGAIVAARPGVEQAGLEKPLAMLLFGMMNWMFTWLRPQGALTHDDLARVVGDLFFGGLPAVQLAGGRRSDLAGATTGARAPTKTKLPRLRAPTAAARSLRPGRSP